MTTKINVFFVYQEGKPLFRVHGDSGAIRKINVKGGKLVFLQKEHTHKFESGIGYAGLFNLTTRPEKSTELLIPIVGEEIVKIEPKTIEQETFKKPNKKKVGKSYFENYGVSFSSPKSILNTFFWAAKKGNLKLIKRLANLSWEINGGKLFSQFCIHSESNLRFAMNLAKENKNKTVIAFLETI